MSATKLSTVNGYSYLQSQSNNRNNNKSMHNAITSSNSNAFKNNNPNLHGRGASANLEKAVEGFSGSQRYETRSPASRTSSQESYKSNNGNRCGNDVSNILPRVIINTTRSSLSSNSDQAHQPFLELTLQDSFHEHDRGYEHRPIEDDNDDDPAQTLSLTPEKSHWSGASSVSCDSFVKDSYNDINEERDQSFDDPFLIPKQSQLTRRQQRHRLRLMQQQLKEKTKGAKANGNGNGISAVASTFRNRSLTENSKSLATRGHTFGKSRRELEPLDVTCSTSMETDSSGRRANSSDLDPLVITGTITPATAPITPDTSSSPTLNITSHSQQSFEKKLSQTLQTPSRGNNISNNNGLSFFQSPCSIPSDIHSLNNSEPLLTHLQQDQNAVVPQNVHVDRPSCNQCEAADVSIPSDTSCVVNSRPDETLAELVYWNNVVASRLNAHGKLHLKTGDAYVQCGIAHYHAKDYVSAQLSFQAAYRIFRDLHRPLGIAVAMERMGMAIMASSPDDMDSLQRAYTVLLEAFRIRQSHLGSWHPDTVDCMNWIGKVHMLCNNLQEARRCYWQVFWVRRAIFGSDHPSCAVAAHDLANLYFKLGRIQDANNFFQIALEVYEKLKLSHDNPSMARLIRDLKRLHRIAFIRQGQHKHERQQPRPQSPPQIRKQQTFIRHSQEGLALHWT